MRISLKLFASLPRHVPGARVGVPVEVEMADRATVGDLVAQLNLPPGEVKVVFVNGRAREAEWQLEAGDQVGIFPPIGGG